jgi:F-type H+-transporting ATPase subunit epsilon
MADTIHLDLVTPERRLIEADVSELTAEAFEGQVTILPGHANFVTILQCGELAYVENGKRLHLAVTGGFAEVTLDEGIRIMAEAAEFPHEIDLDRAKAACGRAERRITDFAPGAEEIDILRAQSSLKRALNRIKVADKKN